jgi:DNA primase
VSGDLAGFKARLPIIEVVARYVRLTRNGPIWKGLCPFHQEKTPSFTVTESRGTYHCFGCGAHGNGIDFLMAMEGLDFASAVRRAAELTGLEPPVTDRPDPARARALGLTDVLEAAARFYRAALARPEGGAAAAYAARRGLDPATLDAFEVATPDTVWLADISYVPINEGSSRTSLCTSRAAVAEIRPRTARCSIRSVASGNNA